jgi:sigma-B regulation protein RsbU (phosphoserine phosphatase)
MQEIAEQLERSLRLYKGLVEVSSAINSITEFDELLGAILEVAQRVMSAEASSLFLRDEHGDLVLTVARGPSNIELGDKRIVVPRGHGISGWVIENGRSLLVPDAYADPRFYVEADRQTGYRTRSIICAPLSRGGMEIGVLQVLNPLEKTAFEESDLEPFEAYATLAATAIEKLRSFERRVEQERVEQELSLAREIQRSFLPKTLPSASQLDFAATYRPARNIGGDFYDVQRLGPDEIFFTIGDVSGKGIPAALMMAQAISMLRIILQPGLSPAEALKSWNRRLYENAFRGMFITAIVGRITISENQIELAGAGHHPPVQLPFDNSRPAFSMTPPLGILPEIEPRAHLLTMGAGERLVFYTDGLLESLSETHREFGLDGVTAALRGEFATTAGLVEQLSARETAHRGQAEPHDDLTILALGFR